MNRKGWKQKIALWLALFATVLCTGCGSYNTYEPDSTYSAETGFNEQTEPAVEVPGVDEASENTGQTEPDADGTYTSREDVALYLERYGKLPGNFITKKEAQELGWSGGSLEPYAPGKCIGGDKFGNREGLLPEQKGRVYYECDIDTLGAKSRGKKRIVYSNDGLIYYTDDHYKSFKLLYDPGRDGVKERSG